MNVRQEKFVFNVLAGMTAKAAYIAAGYTARGNSAEVNASRLLRNPQVSAALEAAKAKLADRLEHIAHLLVDGLDNPEKIAAAPLSQIATTLNLVIDKVRLLRGQTTAINEHRDDARLDEFRKRYDALRAEQGVTDATGTTTTSGA